MIIDIIMHDHEWKPVPLSRNLWMCTKCVFMRYREDDGTLREPTLQEMRIYHSRLDDELRRAEKSFQRKGLIRG